MKNGKVKTEEQLAHELVKHLDGVPIYVAKNALEHAVLLLSSTQIVSAKSPLLSARSKISDHRRT